MAQPTKQIDIYIKKQMMKYIFPFLIGFLLVASCSTDDNDIAKNSYYMTTISGGFAGTVETYKKGEVVWSFDDNMEMLTVKNNSSNTTLGLQSGNYNIELITVDDRQYIVIDSNEMGEINFTTNAMFIDGNSHSGSSGADFYVYQFTKY